MCGGGGGLIYAKVNSRCSRWWLLIRLLPSPSANILFKGTLFKMGSISIPLWEGIFGHIVTKLCRLFCDPMDYTP